MSLGEVITHNTFNSGETLQVKEFYTENAGRRTCFFVVVCLHHAGNRRKLENY